MSALSQCRAARTSAMILAVVWSLASVSAHAQGAPPPAAPPAATEAPPAPAGEMAGRPLFEGVHFAIGSSFGSDTPLAFLAGNADAFLYGIGLVLIHDSNLPTDKTNATAVVSAAYMLHNKFPFAMGPEVDIAPELAPKAFDGIDLRLGWAFWYAPWNIPAAIGPAVFLDLDFPSGKSSVIATLSPAVRIVFGFH